MTTPPEAVPWQRLDRRMLLVHPIQDLARGIIPLLLVLVSGRGHLTNQLISLGLGVFLVVAGVLRWFTTWYRITPEQLQIRRGILNRRVSTARLERIRTVDVTTPFLHRLLHIGRVVIGTGRTDTKRQHDLVLDGLAPEQAEQLRALLLGGHAPAASAPPSAPPSGPTVAAPSAPGVAGRVGPVPTPAPAPAPAPADVELVRWQPRWVVLAPFTLSGAVTALVIVGFAYRLFSEARINPASFALTRQAWDQLRRTPVWVDVVEVVVGAVVVIAVLSVIGYVLAFSGFRLTRRPDGTLHVSRGLITRRETTLEHRRVRGVELSEPLLLRAVGGARLIAIATGLRVGRGAERGGSMLVPPSPRAVDVAAGADVVGDPQALVTPLVPHGPAAVRRRQTRALVPAVVLAAVLVPLAMLHLVPGWLGVVAVVLLPLAALLAADRARSLGHAVRGGLVVTRYGSLVRRRCVFATDGVIGVTVRASPFQRRAGVVTLHLTTAAGRQHYPLTDLTEATAWEVAARVVPALGLSAHDAPAPAVAARPAATAAGAAGPAT